MKQLIISISFILAFACQQPIVSNQSKCGDSMNQQEMDLYIQLQKKQGSDPYREGNMKVYDELNNIIRKETPDSVEFEVFLDFANEEIAGVSVFTPNYQWLADTIVCSFVNASYSSMIPSKVYMTYYYYKNNNPSLSPDFQFGIKVSKN